ncbi:MULTISPECIES: protein-L-isoaspartate(D-aspartate) O-methyltransferase [Paraburkholderia]|uniref:Protein-L-isoaspartate O-methyltransferase n=1 Tax=Paraburkholderia phenazinium TaxID=60549 RepID=A0A1N6GZI7_9BURK|nr:protein-L-isoaspartate(D-aspartate) O-methyltransferase [Paraburkholderia phenazinium]SIO12847.1 protein-L-isoaspartate(D-aspartate) O-methyltransferase [Paraburkholderia phenazinium]
MTQERAKRFPLGLEDLVREPRRPEGRPGEVRAANLAAATDRANGARAKTPARGEAAGNRAPGQPAKAAAAVVVKPVVKPVAKAAPAVAKPIVARQVVAKPMAKPAVKAAPATPKPVVAKPVAKAAASAGSKSGAVLAASTLANRAAPPKPVALRPLERSVGAPNVALNGALALTSERVRERMVERLRANGITDQRVVHAMSVVPRHMFVDPGLAPQAYEDAALPIGHHQTISKPSVVARMIELAAAGRTLNNVLEIGTGCGYQAAVLSQVARDVYSIERIKPLYERAKTNLRPLRIPNIRLHYGDGRIGLPAAAPFDAIVIAAAGLDVPQALLEQLAIGGRLVAPVGTQDGQTQQVLTLVERTGPAQWRESRLDRVFFVPLKSGVI